MWKHEHEHYPSAQKYFKSGSADSPAEVPAAEAIELYSRAIELDPDYASAYYNRGREYDTARAV